MTFGNWRLMFLKLQTLIADLSIDDWILVASAGEVFRAVLPEGGQGAERGGVVAALQEVAQALALRAPVRGIFGIVDVDLELGGEKVCEAGV